MEAIKKIVRIPKDHEVRIKVPQYVPENELVEIVLIIRKKSEDFKRKINDLRVAMDDKLFLDDLENISGEFATIDIYSARA